MEDLSGWSLPRRRRPCSGCNPPRPDDAARPPSWRLRGHLDTGELDGREEAIAALAGWAGREATPHLLPLLSDDADEVTRLSVLRALRALRDPRGAPKAADALATRPRRRRRCLRAIGSAAEDAVIPKLNDLDDLVRAAAVGVLADIGTARSLPALRTATNDPSADVKQAARKAIRLVESRTTGGR